MKDETWKIKEQLTSYEGEEKYAFISYSHDDADSVIPILQRLQGNGVRFWYDGCIEYGVEWEGSIADHLENCYVCLAFMSSNSFASSNCADEISYARSNEKGILPIMLESAKIPSWIKMRFSRRQFLEKYKYSDEQFLDRLLNVPLIRDCREVRHLKRGTIRAAAPAAPAEKPAASRPKHVLMPRDILFWDKVPGSSIYIRGQISSITFLDTMDGISSDAWDVSEARDRSVMAWAKPNDKLFDLYIGAKGGVTAPANCSCLFNGYTNVKSIQFSGAFNTANVTNMKRMFDNCRSLTALDLRNFDIAKVRNMESMFGGCDKLTSLLVKNWNTTSIDIKDMFIGCPLSPKVTSAILSGRSISTPMPDYVLRPDMIYKRYARKSISTITFLDNLYGIPADAWDVSEARDRSVMAWAKPNGSLFDLYIGAKGGVTAPTDCAALFADCINLSAVHFGVFDTANVTNMSCMFYGCGSLETLDLSNFRTAKVRNMGCMFGECGNLKTLKLYGFDTANVTSMTRMFYGCSSLEELDLDSFNTANVTSMTEMFWGCSGLKEVYMSSFVISEATLMWSMFEGCGNLSKLRVAYDWDTSKAFTSGMFHGCPEVELERLPF